MIFKITLIIFALFALSKTLGQYRKQRASLYWFGLWTTFWLVVIFVAWLPQTTDVFAKYVGVEKGADLLVYCAVVVLFYTLYRIMVRQEKMHHEVTELIRRIAIMEEIKKH